MTLEHLIVGGGVAAVLVGLSIYAFKLRNRASIGGLVATLKPAERVAAQAVQSAETDAAVLLVRLVDMLDANGKLTSARRQTTRLTEAAADGHDAKFAATLGPKDQTQPATPAAS